MGFSSENIEKRCPKCGAERELQSVILALPGYIDPKYKRPTGDSISLKDVLPVRVVLCPGCQYIELYRDTA